MLEGGSGSSLGLGAVCAALGDFMSARLLATSWVARVRAMFATSTRAAGLGSLASSHECAPRLGAGRTSNTIKALRLCRDAYAQSLMSATTTPVAGSTRSRRLLLTM